jgi:hypothetical protein
VAFNVLNRKIHYWASFAVAIPLLVMISSGLLLQAKKHWAWVQPVENRGTGTEPVLDFDGILAAIKRVADMNVQSWSDVNRLDVRPGRGMVKVWLHNGWEIQVDLSNGTILQTAYRRSDLIESIHDGSFFGGDWTKPASSCRPASSSFFCGSAASGCGGCRSLPSGDEKSRARLMSKCLAR